MIVSIEKLNRVLLSLLGSNDLVNRWWASPNKAFNNQKPRDVYIDSPETVSKYIFDQLEAPH